MNLKRLKKNLNDNETVLQKTRNRIRVNLVIIYIQHAQYMKGQ